MLGLLLRNNFIEKEDDGNLAGCVFFYQPPHKRQEIHHRSLERVNHIGWKEDSMCVRRESERSFFCEVDYKQSVSYTQRKNRALQIKTFKKKIVMSKRGIGDCIAKRYREINMKHSSKRRHMDTPWENLYVFSLFY